MAGCNITDIEGTLSKITSSDEWPEKWEETALKYHTLAKEAERASHRATAYEMYFYAMIYYYEGQKILFEESERKVRLYRQVLEAYDKVLEFCPYPAEKVQIPYGDIELPAILHKPPHGDGPFPCLLFIQGMDSSKEEWQRWGEYAIERGFALLCVDTPGHGETRHLHRATLDIKNLIAAGTVCREYLEARPDIIKGKVGVLGNCLGSNYGFQIAMHDHQFACCLIILAISEFRVKTSEKDVPKWFVDMVRFFTGDSTGKEGAFEKYRNDFRLDQTRERVKCNTHLMHPEEDNWLDWGQVEIMASYVDAAVKITPVKGAPVFEGNIMSHLVPIYEQSHWVIPVAFDWVQDQLLNIH